MAYSYENCCIGSLPWSLSWFSVFKPCIYAVIVIVDVVCQVAVVVLPFVMLDMIHEREMKIFPLGISIRMPL